LTEKTSLSEKTPAFVISWLSEVEIKSVFTLILSFRTTRVCCAQAEIVTTANKNDKIIERLGIAAKDFKVING
jgi:hypothetical protein